MEKEVVQTVKAEGRMKAGRLNQRMTYSGKEWEGDGVGGCTSGLAQAARKVAEGLRIQW
jgi:hypothetical protein